MSVILFKSKRIHNKCKRQVRLEPKSQKQLVNIYKKDKLLNFNTGWRVKIFFFYSVLYLTSDLHKKSSHTHEMNLINNFPSKIQSINFDALQCRTVYAKSSMHSVVAWGFWHFSEFIRCMSITQCRWVTKVLCDIFYALFEISSNNRMHECVCEFCSTLVGRMKCVLTATLCRVHSSFYQIHWHSFFQHANKQTNNSNRTIQCVSKRILMKKNKKHLRNACM